MTTKPERLFCLLGNPVSHSLSPVMHRAAFRAMNLNACYHAFCVKDLSMAIDGIRGLNIDGASVTIPFKEAVISYLDEIDEDARRIGAVNTILNRDGQLLGFNTDAAGFMKALQSVMDPRGKEAFLLGAGGAARAIAYALIKAGAKVTILNRTEKRAESLAKELACEFLPWEKRGELKGEILINATPIGMFPQTNASPFPEERLFQFALVVDIVYNPPETKLISAARKAGALTQNGIEMFVEQGAEQIRIWTGLKPPVDVMRRTVEEVIRK